MEKLGKFENSRKWSFFEMAEFWIDLWRPKLKHKNTKMDNDLMSTYGIYNYSRFALLSIGDFFLYFQRGLKNLACPFLSVMLMFSFFRIWCSKLSSFINSPYKLRNHFFFFSSLLPFHDNSKKLFRFLAYDHIVCNGKNEMYNLKGCIAILKINVNFRPLRWMWNLKLMLPTA